MTKDTNEQKQNDIRIGVICASAVIGAACISVGYILGRHELSPTERHFRQTLYAARRDGCAPIHWVTNNHEHVKFIVKFVSENLN